MELQRLPVPSSKLISALRTIALIDGIGGMVGALFVLGAANSIGIALAVGVLLQGITVYVLFMVIAQMAENLIAIRQNTDKTE
jgi:hypothetical protein